MFKSKDNKKDECQLLKLLENIKVLFKDVEKYQVKDVNIGLEEIEDLINRVKLLHTEAHKVMDCLEDKAETTKDKKYALQLNLLASKFRMLDELNDKMDEYMKSLNEYKKLGDENNVKKVE